MVLLLHEQDVARLVGIDDALVAVEHAFHEQGHGRATVLPRQRAVLAQSALNLMGGAIALDGFAGLKTYFITPQGVRFLVVLFAEDSGQTVALIEADMLGRLRTGAASGVATRCLARADAQTLGIFGSGGQARRQIEAVCAVRQIETVWVYSRNGDRRAAFCAEMSHLLNRPVIATPAEQTAAADIVVTITSSREPVLMGQWLRPGTHINAAGSNSATRRELDTEAVRRCNLIAIDHRAQGEAEAGDLLPVIEQGHLTWEQVIEMGSIIAGTEQGRASASDITLFKSLGIGTEDVALAAEVYRRAQAHGIGESIGLWS